LGSEMCIRDSCCWTPTQITSKYWQVTTGNSEDWCVFPCLVLDPAAWVLCELWPRCWCEPPQDLVIPTGLKVVGALKDIVHPCAPYIISLFICFGWIAYHTHLEGPQEEIADMHEYWAIKDSPNWGARSTVDHPWVFQKMRNTSKQPSKHEEHMRK
jgi:hypothetical protein